MESFKNHHMIDTLEAIQKLKAQICEEENNFLDSQKKQRVEQRIIEVQKNTNRDVQMEMQSLDADFQKHYNTLQKIVQSISSQIN